MILLAFLHDPAERSSKRRKINPVDSSTSGSPCKGSVVRTGKVSHATLPGEYQLARLVREIGNLPKSWNTKTPACEWLGAKCNDEGLITEIHWDQLQLYGLLRMQHLPETVLVFTGIDNTLEGRNFLGDLPSGHKIFSIGWNKFDGELDLTVLPQGMISVLLYDNEFSGEVCLTSLPHQLQKLSLARNRLSGTPDLTALPASLRHLGLCRNRFSGIADITQLPPSVRTVDLSFNPDLLCRMDGEHELKEAGRFGFCK